MCHAPPGEGPIARPRLPVGDEQAAPASHGTVFQNKLAVIKTPLLVINVSVFCESLAPSNRRPAIHKGLWSGVYKYAGLDWEIVIRLSELSHGPPPLPKVHWFSNQTPINTLLLANVRAFCDSQTAFFKTPVIHESLKSCTHTYRGAVW